MEDTLRGIKNSYTYNNEKVLILVLMEDTLRGWQHVQGIRPILCLNPCFNGRYSQRLTTVRVNILH